MWVLAIKPRSPVRVASITYHGAICPPLRTDLFFPQIVPGYPRPIPSIPLFLSGTQELFEPHLSDPWRTMYSAYALQLWFFFPCKLCTWSSPGNLIALSSFQGTSGEQRRAFSFATAGVTNEKSTFKHATWSMLAFATTTINNTVSALSWPSWYLSHG